MSSVHEVIPWAGHVNYAASKGGVMLLMKSMAQELAPKKIRVNSIAPGAIKTPINRAAWDTPAAEAELLKLIPEGRVGLPEDIARTAVWLASDASDYVTGHDALCRWRNDALPRIRHRGLRLGLRVRRRHALHRVLGIEQQKFARSGGEKLLLLRQELRHVRGREIRVGPFHFSVLDQNHEIISGDRRVAELSFLQASPFAGGPRSSCPR